MVLGRYANLHRIERLDPSTDFDEIFRLVTQYEFPWEYVQGTSIAFMRDYGVPSISELLDRTGQFEHHVATTIVGPKRFIDAYGWRPLHPHEVESMHRVTTRFGELMGIKGLPSSYEGYERFLDEYEAERFEFAPQNKRVAEASLRIVENWYPSFVRPALRRISIAMLDEPLRGALGLGPDWLREAPVPSHPTRTA